MSAPVTIAIWNQLGRRRSEVVTLPVASADVDVTAADGQRVDVLQVNSAVESVTNYARHTAEASFVASFKADLPPVGLATYTISPRGKSAAAVPAAPTPAPAPAAAAVPARRRAREVAAPSNDVVIENEHVRLTFAASTGRLSAMSNKASHTSTAVDQSFCYYESYAGLGQKSGAYIFRPDRPDAACAPVGGADGKVTIASVMQGDLIQEVRQVFAPWLTQTVRLVAGERHASFEWTVGEVPLHDPRANATREQCVGWRATADCVASGKRQPEKDLGCTDTVPSAVSGYCECFDGRRAAMSGCARHVDEGRGEGGVHMMRMVARVWALPRHADCARPMGRCGAHVDFTCADECKMTSGKEVVSRFVTPIPSAGEILTDSNGREMLARRRDSRATWKLNQTEPVAGNYYPVNAAAAIRGGGAQITVLVDRAQAHPSLRPDLGSGLPNAGTCSGSSCASRVGRRVDPRR